MISPGRRAVTGHRDLADLLRAQITTGQLAPGSRFPSERDLQGTYELGRDAVRAAVQLLRYEGLVVARHGKPSRVRNLYPKQPIDMSDVDHIDIRMPTPDERDDLGVDEGVPVFEVHRAGREKPVLLPGDRWRVPRPGTSNA